jgi:hypothetical protein
MEEKKNAYNILIGKPEGKRLLRKPKCKLEDNIKMELIEIGWEVVNWTYLAQVSD